MNSLLFYNTFMLASTATCRMRDPSSNANIDKAVVKKIFLRWDVDFDKRRIFGTASLDVDIIDPTNILVSLAKLWSNRLLR